MKNLFTYLKGDRVLWMIFFLLGSISLLAVYSSIPTLANKRGGNTTYFFIKHGSMIGIGAIAAYFVHNIKYKYFSKLSQLFYWLSIGLLILTLVFGSNINNATRWLVIPIINQGFQPSDLAKIALISFIARFIHTRQKEGTISSFYQSTLPMIVSIGLICILILPSNFSTAFMLGAISLVIMFIGKVPVKHLAGIIGAAAVLIALIFTIGTKYPDLLPRASTWTARIKNFESGDSKANYQVEQAKIAIASGGIIPKGPGKGNSRNFMPHPYSDMIYAFLIEEYGIILGGLGVLLLYLMLFFRTLKIAQSAETTFGMLLAFGLGFSIMFQSFINMAVSVNLIPVTGQPLPLISMGGTSALFTGITFGIILSVSRGLNQLENEQNLNNEPINKININAATA